MPSDFRHEVALTSESGHCVTAVVINMLCPRIANALDATSAIPRVQHAVFSGFRRSPFSRTAGRCLIVLAGLLNLINSGLADDEAGVASVRCVLVEVYLRHDDAQSAAAVQAAEDLKSERGGIMVVIRRTESGSTNETRLKAISSHYRVSSDSLPLIYTCNRVIHGRAGIKDWGDHLRQALRAEVFTRLGCSRCAAAKAWLPGFVRQYPGFEFTYYDLVTDPGTEAKLSKLVEQHHTMAASVPVFHLCNALVIGFDSPEFSGERLKTLLKRWTYPCPAADGLPGKTQPAAPSRAPPGDPGRKTSLRAPRQLPSTPLVPAGPLFATGFHPAAAVSLLVAVVPQSFPDDPPAPEPELPLPGFDAESEPGAADLPLPESADAGPAAAENGDAVTLPVFGRISVSELGMPLFTIAVGLVDGFNPCAMWVLLFLLSILVNLQNRWRILAIAGTFVIVSGVAYFAFMAAWLNVFMLIGIVRPVQIGLALLAIVIGSIHVKDFFAFHQGLSLSIPESVKPGIYARVRNIVTAEHLPAAIAGAITLAVLVNVVELLCTAGLPALYTNILMQQGYSAAVRYLYLMVYVLAYMLDDSLMVAAVITTLSKRKLQETQGRWLKLISGGAILGLGVVMLLRPEWLE